VLRRALDVVARVADADVSILVRGESGTGKELVARALHDHSARAGQPFIAVNCGALPEPLLEAEIFGYVKGAFTGASRDKEGLLLAADQGTLFLDEIGEMPEALQVKLLRVLQEREVMPLGTTRARKFDIRLVSATNRNLRDEIARGRFREDLYYRIAVVEIELPPLRQRAEDIPALVERIMTRLAASSNRAPKTISPGAMQELMRARWPGNVRELDNVLARAFFLSDGPRIESFQLVGARAKETTQGAMHPRGHRPAEAAGMREALVATGWNVAEAARALQIPRVTFYRKMRRYGIEPPPPRLTLPRR
jgi:transcriptional regulator with PAS, ATPase and Fis domain